MATLPQRMMRAAKLDAALYEEVEHDRDSTAQAMLVVVLSSLAAGVGAFSDGGAPALIFITLASLVGWVVWAFLTYIIGTRLLPEPQTQASFGELLRTTGFSSSPGVLRLLASTPGVGFVIFSLANLWMLVAMVVAVRQALDYRSTGRAVGVCLIGWLIQVVVLLLVGPSPFVEPAS